MNQRYFDYGIQRALALFLFLATLEWLHAETTDTIRRTFNASPEGRLMVEVDRGQIEVGPSGGSTVTVEVIRKVKSSSQKREIAYLKEHQVTIEQSGDTVNVRARLNSWSKASWWRRLNADFRYLVTVPESFRADLKTAGGSIRVEHLTGPLKVNTSGGNLQFQSVTGLIDGRTSGGGITMANCSGTVRVHTSGGSIHSRDGKGSLDVDTSGGGINIQNHSGHIHAHSSGGSVTCEQVEGALQADSSGGGIRASMKGQPMEDWRLTTSGGGITVKLPQESNLAINAATSGGSVRTDLPVIVSGRMQKDRLIGQLGGGGKLLYLRTSGGGIHIQRI